MSEESLSEAIIRRAGIGDIGRINEIANDDTVRPFVSLPGQDFLDLGPIILDDNNVVLMTDHGCFVGIRHEPSICEVHTLFLPEGRGRHAFEAAQASFAFMFIRTLCLEIQTKIPINNRRAKKLATALGFKLEFTRKNAWPTEDGLVDCEYFTLRYGDWAQAQTVSPTYGQWFHEQLGEDNTNHEDDVAHDRHVGLAVLMILAGMPIKGVALYNRWARFAGYETIEIIQDSPLRIDIKTHVLEMSGEGFKICP